MHRRTFLRPAVGLACALAAACASAGPAKADTTLRVRVEQYWKARQTKDLGAMYEFYSPQYRAKTPRTEFLKLTRLTRFDIVEFRVADVSPTGDRAEVTIEYRAVVPQLPTPSIQSKTTETWIRDSGRWYKLDEPVIVPFPK